LAPRASACPREEDGGNSLLKCWILLIKCFVLLDVEIDNENVECCKKIFEMLNEAFANVDLFFEKC
jgi:hypothetical protein